MEEIRAKAAARKAAQQAAKRYSQSF